MKQHFRSFGVVCLFLLLGFGCQKISHGTHGRQDFKAALTDICKNKYQARVVCRDAGDTLWAYLAFTPGRRGSAKVKLDSGRLDIDYSISSFNPYKTIDPPELRFLSQKIVGEIRSLLLASDDPYKFFVLVVTDVSDPMNNTDQWHIGYLEDVRFHKVGLDFSGEGYNRLVWHVENFWKPGKEDKEASPSYRDIKGDHFTCHDLTMEEFIEKQIKWRIYKRFTMECNKTPFDITPAEKREEVLGIVKTVFIAYNFKSPENIQLSDSSFLEGQAGPSQYSKKDIEEFKVIGEGRRSSF